MKKILFFAILFMISLVYLFKYSMIILGTSDFSDTKATVGYFISLVGCFVSAAIWIKEDVKKQGGADK